MKKIRLLSVAAASMLLCGCSGGSPFGGTKPNYDSAYTVSAEIKCGSLEAAADITRNGTGSYIFSFSKPQSLAGISVSLSDGEYTAALENLSVTVDDCSAYCALTDLIAESIDSLAAVDSDSITRTEDALTLTTRADGSRVVVTTAADGTLLTLKCPARSLSVNFSQQSEIKLEEPEEQLDIIIED